MRRAALGALMCLVLSAGATPAAAQVVHLEGEWHFRLGDDPSWADPALDDADWETLEMPGGWAEHHIEDYGFGWYRRRIEVPEAVRAAEELGLLIPGALHATELYVDGQRVGAYGRMPPDLSVHPNASIVFDVPRSAAQDGEVLIAVRVYLDRAWLTATSPGGGPRAGFDPRMDGRFALGERAHLRGVLAAQRASIDHREMEQVSLLVAGLLLALGVLALMLFAAQRTRTEYLYAGLACVSFCPSISFTVAVGFLRDRTSGFEVMWTAQDVLADVGTAMLMAFLVHVLEPPRWAGRPVLAIAFALPVFSLAAWLYSPLLLINQGVDLFVLFVDAAAVLAFAVVGLRRGRRDARTLLWGLGTSLSLLMIAAVVLQLTSFGLAGWIVAMAGFAGVVGTLAYLLADRARRAVRDLEQSHAASRRFVPAEFLAALERDNVVDVERGDARAAEMTVLFADIRGFTALSERLGPERTFAFMNDYHAVMGPVIASRGGFINQYYGDGIMALFDNADSAVSAAREMLGALEGFNETHEPIAIGVGLHTGEVMLGTIGDEQRLDTGVIGDAVNTAARIQDLTKEHGRPLLMSAATKEALANDADLEEVATVTPKGKSEAITLFGVGG